MWSITSKNVTTNFVGGSRIYLKKNSKNKDNSKLHCTTFHQIIYEDITVFLLQIFF